MLGAAGAGVVAGAGLGSVGVVCAVSDKTAAPRRLSTMGMCLSFMGSRGVYMVLGARVKPDKWLKYRSNTVQALVFRLICP